MGGRIFLVDDERPVLDGISAAIRKRLPDALICGTASSGREAIEKVARERPDVVLMDVRMPGMSGLDALRELRALAPDTVPVLLTAYERFDVAREAFGLGVHDYLVKPVDQDALVAAIRGALDAAAARRAEAARARDAMDALERTRALLEVGLVDAALYRPDGGAALPAFAATLGLPGVRGAFAAFGRRDATGAAIDTQRLRGILGYREPCAVGAQESGAVPVFFPAGSEAAARASREALRDPVLAGVGAGVGTDCVPAEARSSWLGALAALSTAGPGQVEVAGAAARERRQAESSVAALAEATLAAASDGDSALALASWSTLARDGRADPVTLAAVAGAASWSLRRDPKAVLEVARAVAAGSSPGGSLGAPIRQLGLSGRVGEILRYMEEHYSEQISLEDAAERFGLSPAHLTRVLAAETGRSFMDHLTELRIARAKAELSAGTLSVKEISAAVGYADPNYFSRAFRRATGLSPSEYARTPGGES